MQRHVWNARVGMIYGRQLLKDDENKRIFKSTKHILASVFSLELFLSTSQNTNRILNLLYRFGKYLLLQY